MKLIFAGTPEFAAIALEAILQAGHEVALVLTQPDRPAGRGMKLTPSPVKQTALRHGLPVSQPLTLKEAAAQAELAAVGAEAMVVAAYGLILPKAVLELFPRGCLNIHASLLPRWRGAAPIQRAILAGDERTGITIMQMDEGLDTGAMLLKGETPIGPQDTAQILHDRLAVQGGQLIVAVLARPDDFLPQPQDGAQATYAAKLTKQEGAVDWSRPAAELDRAVRAYNPFPAAHTTLAGEMLKIWSARPAAGNGAPGEVLAATADGIVVACGEGALCLDEMQKAGGKRLSAAQFLQGNPLAAGSRLGG